MKKKFFVISDVHGFYDEMISALNDAGFDPKNENHVLVSLGDNVDRGKQPKEVVKYLVGLPNKVLVRGNHEDLFVACCKRGFPIDIDYYNGTFNSLLDMGGVSDVTLDWFGSPAIRPYEENTTIESKNLASFYVDVINNQMVDYFETKNYIFVHSCIPYTRTTNLNGFEYNYSYWETWRDCSKEAWDNARWGNPFKIIPQINKTGKIIVFGHFHTSYAHCNLDHKCSEFDEDAIFTPYYGDGLVGIDACTAHSGKVNVLVVEDDVE